MSHVISELLYCNFGALNRDYGGGNFVTLEKGLLHHIFPASLTLHSYSEINATLQKCSSVWDPSKWSRQTHEKKRIAVAKN